MLLENQCVEYLIITGELPGALHFTRTFTKLQQFDDAIIESFMYLHIFQLLWM